MAEIIVLPDRGGNPSVVDGPSDIEVVSFVPPEIGAAGFLGFGDMEAAFNMRGWLQRACEAQGARMTGGGFGGGVADIDIQLEGCRYNLTIKPT